MFDYAISCFRITLVPQKDSERKLAFGSKSVSDYLLGLLNLFNLPSRSIFCNKIFIMNNRLCIEKANSGFVASLTTRMATIGILRIRQIGGTHDDDIASLNQRYCCENARCFYIENIIVMGDHLSFLCSK